LSRILFNGKVLREPRAASRLRVGLPPTVNPNSTNRVLVIGSADGGLPVADQKVYTFNNILEATAVLRGGDSLRSIDMIFNPSSEFAGAGQVDFIRSDDATAGTLNLKDTAGSPVNTILLTSVDKGTWVNGIQVSVATSSSDRKVTVKIPSPVIQSGADGVLTNVASTYFLESATAKFITKGARIGDAIAMSGQTDTSLGVFTIKAIVSETKVQLTETPAPTTGATLTWSHFVYGRTLTSPVLTQSGDTSNPNQNIINWLNTNFSDVLTASQVAAGIFVAATAAARNLTGGTVSNQTTTGNITLALALARDLNVQHIYTAKACGTQGGETDFAGLISGHILNDAEVPAIGYVGGTTDLTMTNAITYAGAINNGKMMYCYQTVLESTVDGLSTEYLGGYFLSARICGLVAGLPPQTPATRKSVNIRGIKVITADGKLDRAKRELLLAAGICHVFQQPGTTPFVVNQDVTTLQKQDSLWDASTATASVAQLNRISDNLLYNLKASADKAFIGSAGIPKSVVENFVRSYLESERGNLIVDWRNIVVSQVLDTWDIGFSFIPSYATDYITITGVVVG
jgi:hypothetical protein